VNTDARDGNVIPASLVVPFVLLLHETNIMWYGNHVWHQHT